MLFFPGNGLKRFEIEGVGEGEEGEARRCHRCHRCHRRRRRRRRRVSQRGGDGACLSHRQTRPPLDYRCHPAIYGHVLV